MKPGDMKQTTQQKLDVSSRQKDSDGSGTFCAFCSLWKQIVQSESHAGRPKKIERMVLAPYSKIWWEVYCQYKYCSIYCATKEWLSTRIHVHKAAIKRSDVSETAAKPISWNHIGRTLATQPISAVCWFRHTVLIKQSSRRSLPARCTCSLYFR